MREHSRRVAESRERGDDRHPGRQIVGTSPDLRSSNPRIPSVTAPSMSAQDCRQPSSPRAAGTPAWSSARSKMLGCGFMNPCSADDTAVVISVSNLKCALNVSRLRCEFEMTPSVRPRPTSCVQDRRDIVIHLEVMIRRPLFVDPLGNTDDVGAAAAHVLDDCRRIVHEDRRIVDGILDLVQDERRRRHRG